MAHTYDVQLASYCENIVQALFLYYYGGEYIGLVESEKCTQHSYNMYQNPAIDELLTYKLPDKLTFPDKLTYTPNDLISRDFLIISDFCYALARDNRVKKCEDIFKVDIAQCTGIAGLASGRDFLLHLIIYTNYTNIILQIKNSL
ncbi:MAG: hypothetical protein ACI9CD_000734 [Candidatus Deianiraeaceae bacterium]|jgi:hypothetical protein